ncbi:MAG: glycosyltransferase family 1 protein [Solirubrobacterales bacterium]|nr:glycosyltransferase family 1 protein [Solirubrobacterales bacterium]
MRIVFASTRGAGHLTPLLPFVAAARAAGHDARIAGPAPLAAAAEGAGVPFWPVADPDADELEAVWSRVPSLPPAEQNAVVVGDLFARLHAAAALPRMRELCATWSPHVVVRDPNEYASAIAAELEGIAHARVGIGLAASEAQALGWAAGPVDALRGAAGLPGDPAAERLRASPWLTLFPAALEDPADAGQPDTRRFRDPAWELPAAELPDWWPDASGPLVYVTFGSVAGGMPMAGQVYRAALEAVGDLPARVLLTVGHGADLDAFAGAPPNVRVERWVPQQDVLRHAAAVVCHGGSGSTLGALAAGVPLVVLPLFADQPANAARVAAIGAGVAVPPDPAAIREGVRRVLADDGLRAGALRVSQALRGRPTVAAAIEQLEAAVARA